MQALVGRSGVLEEGLLFLGDVNAKDDEVGGLCDKFGLREARYHGYSWGARGNRFDADLEYNGPGIRYDRVLFAGSVWAEAHLVGQRRLFEGGADFCISDHCGLQAVVDMHGVYGSRKGSDGVVARARRGQLVALRDAAVQKELVEARNLERLGREEKELQRQRAAGMDRVEFQKAQQRAALRRTERRAALQSAASGSESLFAPGVVACLAHGTAIPCAPSAVVIRDLGAVGKGGWDVVRELPLRGLGNGRCSKGCCVGNTCYVNSMVQVFIRIPAVVAWLVAHWETCGQRAACPLCALAETRLQVLRGPTQRSQPKLACRRHLVSSVFAGEEQHDVVEFVEKFLDSVRGMEIGAGRFGVWENEPSDRPEPTHGDRLFGFVRETRRLCTVCQRASVRAWFTDEKVWRLVPGHVDGGALTVTEMYMKSCGPEKVTWWCADCAADTEHVCQTRLRTLPNVLLFQVRRRPGEARVPVDVEDRLELPGFAAMELLGVVYHHGATMKSGHYTCVCRGPHGRYWYYDDGRAVVALQKEVSQVKPREVYLLVYCPVDGCAEWQGDAGLLSGVGSDGADAVTGFGEGADVCGAGASGGRSGNGGREKTGGGEGTPRGAVSAWGKPAAPDGGVGAG